GGSPSRSSRFCAGFARSLPLRRWCFSFPESAARAPDRGLRTRPYVLVAPAIAREESRSPQPLKRRSAWRGQNSTTIRRAALSGGFLCPNCVLQAGGVDYRCDSDPGSLAERKPTAAGATSRETIGAEGLGGNTQVSRAWKGAITPKMSTFSVRARFQHWIGQPCFRPAVAPC